METLEKWVEQLKELHSTNYETFSVRRNEILSKNILDSGRYKVPNLMTRSGPYNNYEEVTILLPKFTNQNGLDITITPSVYRVLKKQDDRDSDYGIVVNLESVVDGAPLRMVCRYNTIILQWPFDDGGENVGNYFMQINAPQKYDDVGIYCRKKYLDKPFIRVMEGLEYMQDGILHRCNILGQGLTGVVIDPPFFRAYCPDATIININHTSFNANDDSSFVHMVFEMRKKEYPYGKIPPKVEVIYP